MVDPRATRFWQAAVQSGLIDDAALNTCWESLPEEKRTPYAAERRLARRTIETGHLTVWQAQQLLIGRSNGFFVNKYVLLDRIGQGGMGRVYLARDTRLGRKVALKILSPDRMNNPRAISRFQREARVGAQLAHENLVRIYDEGECRGVYYLVMEFIEGKNVGKIIAELGRLPPATAAGIGRQVAQGLEHANQKGLIHRDVNPWNIMMTSEGIAKLADLGLAIDLNDQDVVTREGATVGTFDFISPEQARHSRSVDTRSDIYSLGCSLYHMIAGRVPFDYPSLPEKLYAHQVKTPDPLTVVAPETPEALDAVVQRMMRKKPADRYQTPLEAAQALEPFVERGTGGVRIGPTIISPNDLSPTEPSSDSDPGVVVVPQGTTQSSTPDSISQSFLPQIDFGPEPALSEGISSVKTKRSSRKSREAQSVTDLEKLSETDLPAHPLEPGPVGDPADPEEPATVRHRLTWLVEPRFRATLVGVAALLILALGLGIGLAIRSGRPGAGREGISDPSGRSASDPTEPFSGSSKGPTASIVIHWENDQEEPVKDLQEAIRKVGSRGQGEVLLSGAEALVLRVNRSLVVPARGRVVIRAAQGREPVLIVAMAGQEPFLRAGTASSLTLDGLTIRAEFFGQEPAPPVIEADGDLQLTHCAFSVSGEGGDLRAVRADGRSVQVSGCWFRGFDRALDLAALPGTTISVRQSLVIWSTADDHPTGWAARLRSKNSDSKASRQISWDHCTVAGGGLMELRDLSVADPLSVQVQNSIIEGPALLMWTSPESAFPKALAWTGQDNRYSGLKTAWVVLDPKGFGTLENGPVDLESWQEMLGSDQESDILPPHFPTTAATASAHFSPKDFAPPENLDDIGADPSQIGPISAR